MELIRNGYRFECESNFVRLKSLRKIVKEKGYEYVLDQLDNIANQYETHYHEHALKDFKQLSCEVCGDAFENALKKQLYLGYYQYSVFCKNRAERIIPLRCAVMDHGIDAVVKKLELFGTEFPVATEDKTILLNEEDIRCLQRYFVDKMLKKFDGFPFGYSLLKNKKQRMKALFDAVKERGFNDVLYWLDCHAFDDYLISEDMETLYEENMKS